MLNNTLLTGELVRLAAVNPEKEAALRVRWFANSEFTRLLDMAPFPRNSVKSSREWMEKHLSDWLEFEFSIETLADSRSIGFVGLDGDGIRSPHRDAFVGIGIGEPEFWGKGYGTDAMKLILRYAFLELNLHRVSLDVFDYNPRAIRSYEKAGFKLEGRMRGGLLREGQRSDMVFMGVLREDWMESNVLSSPQGA
jgi:RimJ/RimL family protein N-acetyltransferase